jgi:hypothetical protein
MTESVKFIDLFAGIGSMRIAFESVGSQSATQAMLGMKKINLAEMKKAYEGSS